ncbi:MAG: hypothetical protein RLZZ416_606 [Candidatus Parcubacteria bacterium]|jgi:hypothetical protein
MREGIQPVPNTPEYIEVIKTGFKDAGNKLHFEFKFAHPVSPERMKEMWGDKESAIHNIMLHRLQEKGWLTGNGMNETVPFSNAGEHSDDGRTWTFECQRTDVGDEDDED